MFGENNQGCYVDAEDHAQSWMAAPSISVGSGWRWMFGGSRSGHTDTKWKGDAAAVLWDTTTTAVVHRHDGAVFSTRDSCVVIGSADRNVIPERCLSPTVVAPLQHLVQHQTLLHIHNSSHAARMQSCQRPRWTPLPLRPLRLSVIGRQRHLHYWILLPSKM